MRKRNAFIVLAILVFWIVLHGCGGPDSSSNNVSVQEITDPTEARPDIKLPSPPDESENEDGKEIAIEIVVTIPENEDSNRYIARLFFLTAQTTISPSDVDSVEAIIKKEDGTAETLNLSQDQTNRRVWSGTTSFLENETATFEVEAVNKEKIALYRGKTTITITDEITTISIPMRPVDNGQVIEVPTVLDLLHDGLNLLVTVSSSVGSTLSYVIWKEADSTDEELISGSFVVDNNRTGTIPWANPEPGEYRIELKNEDQHSSVYPFELKSETSAARGARGVVTPELVFEILQITTIQPTYYKNSIVYKAIIHYDGPHSNLTFFWNFDGQVAFIDPTANPAILPVEPNTSGVVTVEVSDGKGKPVVLNIDLEARDDIPNSLGEYPNDDLSDAPTQVVTIGKELPLGGRDPLGEWESSGGSTPNSPNNVMYGFEVIEIGAVEFELITKARAKIYLLHEDLRPIASTSGFSENGTKLIKGLRPGKYIIVAATRDSGVSEKYKLNVWGKLKDFTKIELPLKQQSISGEWQSSATEKGGPQHQSFLLRVGKQGPVNIEMKSENRAFTTLLKNGTILASARNNGKPQSAFIDRHLSPGKYELIVETASRKTSGTFDLQISGNVDSVEAKETSIPSWHFTGRWNDSEGRTVSSNSNHYYKVTLEKAGRLLVELSSRTVDSYLYLLDEDRQVIRSIDTGGYGSDARLEISLSAGTYTIVAATTWSDQQGDYDLYVVGDVPQPVLQTLPSLQVKGSLQPSTIPDSPSQAAYMFQVNSKGMVQAELSILLNAHFYLLDANKSVLSEGWNYGYNRGIRLSRSLSEGTYYLLISSSAIDNSGSFDLILTGDVSTPEATSWAGTSFEKTGTWQNSGGRNPYSPANSVFQFEVLEESFLFAELVSQANNVLFLLDSKGHKLHYQDGGSRRYDAKFVLKLEPGIYSIVAATYDPGENDTFRLFLTGSINDPKIVSTLAKTFNGTWVAKKDWVSSRQVIRFSVDEPSTVSMELFSSIPSYFSLWNEDLQILRSTYSNRVNESLSIKQYLTEGTYFLSAETNAFKNSGSFQVSFLGEVSGIQLIPQSEQLLEQPGNWTVSGGRSRFAQGNQFYSFTVTENSVVLIDLHSQTDGYLFLLDSNLQTIAVDNDWGYSYNPRISRSLEPGGYVIVVATEDANETGEFDLKVQGQVADLKPKSIHPKLISGQWKTLNRTFPANANLRSVSLVVKEEAQIPIELSASQNSYLALLQDGEIVESDISYFGESAFINKKLKPGAYKIVFMASSKEAGADYTLSVNGNVDLENVETQHVTHLVPGSWESSDGNSILSPHNRHYSFAVTQPGLVVLELSSLVRGRVYLLGSEHKLYKTGTWLSSSNYDRLFLQPLFLQPGTYTAVLTVDEKGYGGPFEFYATGAIQAPQAVQSKAIVIDGSWDSSEGQSLLSSKNWNAEFQVTELSWVHFEVHSSAIPHLTVTDLNLKSVCNVICSFSRTLPNERTLLKNRTTFREKLGPGNYGVTVGTSIPGQQGDFQLLLMGSNMSTPVEKSRVSTKKTGSWLAVSKESGQPQFSSYEFDVPENSEGYFELKSSTATSLVLVDGEGNEILSRSTETDRPFQKASGIKPGHYRLLLYSGSENPGGDYELLFHESIKNVRQTLTEMVVETEVGQWNSSGGASIHSNQNPNFSFSLKEAGWLVIELLPNEVQGRLFLLDETRKLLVTAYTLSDQKTVRLVRYLPAGNYVTVAATEELGKTDSFQILIGGPLDTVQTETSPGKQIRGTWPTSSSPKSTPFRQTQYIFEVKEYDRVNIEVGSSIDLVYYLVEIDGVYSAAKSVRKEVNSRHDFQLYPGKYRMILSAFSPKIEDEFFITLHGEKVETLSLENATIEHQPKTGSWVDSGGNNYLSSKNPHYRFKAIQTGVVMVHIKSDLSSGIYLLNERYEKIDYSPSGSWLSAYLEPGDYFLVATTQEKAQKGEFTISLAGPVTEPEHHEVWPRHATGNWNPNDGDVMSHLSAQYSIEVERDGVVPIHVSSEVSTSLIILDESGSIVGSEMSPSNQIDSTPYLAAGKYKILLMTAATRQSGSFEIFVLGPVSRLDAPDQNRMTKVISSAWEGSNGNFIFSPQNPAWQFRVDQADIVRMELRTRNSDWPSLALLNDSGEVYWLSNTYQGNDYYVLTAALNPGEYQLVARAPSRGTYDDFDIYISGSVEEVTLVNREIIEQTFNWDDESQHDESSPRQDIFEFTLLEDSFVNFETDSTINMYLHVIDEKKWFWWSNFFKNDRESLNLKAGKYTAIVSSNSIETRGTPTMFVSGKIEGWIQRENNVISQKFRANWQKGNTNQFTPVDYHYYDFTVTQFGLVQFEAFSNEVRTFLRLFNGNVMFREDGGWGGEYQGRPFAMIGQFYTPGTYSVQVTKYSPGELAHYNLVITGPVENVKLR